MYNSKRLIGFLLLIGSVSQVQSADPVIVKEIIDKNAVYCKLAEGHFHQYVTNQDEQFKSQKIKQKYGSDYIELRNEIATKYDRGQWKRQAKQNPGTLIISGPISAEFSVTQFNSLYEIKLEVTYKSTESGRKVFLSPFTHPEHKNKLECVDDIGNRYEVFSRLDEKRGFALDGKIYRIDSGSSVEIIQIERPVSDAKTIYIDLPGAIWTYDKPEINTDPKLNGARVGLKIDVAAIRERHRTGILLAEVNKAELIKINTPDGTPAYSVLVEWKNTGDKPIRKLTAHVVMLRELTHKDFGSGNVVLYEVGDNERGILPGEVFKPKPGEAVALKIPKAFSDGLILKQIEMLKVFDLVTDQGH